MVRALATDPVDLNSISGSHIVEAENKLYKLSSDLDKWPHIHIYGHTHKEREEREGGWMNGLTDERTVGLRSSLAVKSSSNDLNLVLSAHIT